MRTLSKMLGTIFTPTKPKQSDQYRIARTQAKALAATLGCDLEIVKEGTRIAGINVWPPIVFADKPSDPFRGDHHASDWNDALEMLREYERAIERRYTTRKAARKAAITSAKRFVGPRGTYPDGETVTTAWIERHADLWRYVALDSTGSVIQVMDMPFVLDGFHSDAQAALWTLRDCLSYYFHPSRAGKGQ